MPCCMAILQFPNMDAVMRWYESPENREAAKVRQSGAKFRLIAVEGLPAPGQADAASSACASPASPRDRGRA